MKQIQETFALLSIYLIAIGLIANAAVAHYQITENAEAIETIESNADDLEGKNRDALELLRVIETDVKWLKRRIGETISKRNPEN